MQLEFIQLLSTIIGFIGTSAMAYASYGLEPPPVAQCCPAEYEAIVNKKNNRRIKINKIGLLLLCLSFLLQIFSLTNENSPQMVINVIINK